MSISFGAMTEMKALAKPPVTVAKVGEMAAILLTGHLKWEWIEVKGLMADLHQFLAKL